MILASATQAFAFPTSVYTSASKLSQGRWVKVSIPTSGLYVLSQSTLRGWGFNDISKVRIHGYGGQRISDVLTENSYIDDLPEVPSFMTSKGIVFYGLGVETWTRGSNGNFTHSLNPFSSVGYYYITESDEAPTVSVTKSGLPKAAAPVTTFTDYLFHEKDIVKPGQTGHLFLGEDFKWTPTQRFTFTLTDLVASEPVTMACSFFAKTQGSTSTVKFLVNNNQLPSSSSDIIASSGTSSHSHGEIIKTVKTFTLPDSKLQLELRYQAQGMVAGANLDYLEFNYTRRLRLDGGILRFDLTSTAASLENATSSTHVWDVTNPFGILEMNTAVQGGAVVWTNDYTGPRRYIAWNEDASLPSPQFVANVANQNLHDPSVTPDMVIFTHPEWESQARRLADYHRNSADSLEVLVLTQELVFNEFSSGCPDVNSFRRYLKMLYDRGNEVGRPLRFALFMGKPTFDNRRILPTSQALRYPVMPTWQSETSLDDNISFTTDDIFAFLKDGSGESMGSDELCIAVGRMPVRSLAEATSAVDKLFEYRNSMSRSIWRNQFMFVADDENNGIHMDQSEEFIRNLHVNQQGSQFFYTKVYLDAFPRESGGYPLARERMFNRLDEGVVWWNYIGHANYTSWSSERILTYEDINNLYIRNYPVLYAATCEFLNWDSPELSGAEILYHTRQGGIIAAITAVRPVYITDNGILGKALAQKVFELDKNGNYLPVGEIYRRGKNNIRNSKGEVLSNTNKLRYVFMGDPAMRFIAPSSTVVLESINGEPLDLDGQITIQARQTVELAGSIYDPQGRLIEDFDGEISVEIFDADISTMSNGYGDGAQVVFDENGSRLFAGRDKVEGGRFKFKVVMPEAVADNFRPASVNMYASADDGRDAKGVCRDFYVYGIDEEAIPDTVAPVIEELYLNHPTFVNGGKVNSSPMLVARVSDDRGINLSASGVGHNMTILIDGSKSLNDVSQFYSPDLGSLSGTIAYPLSDLSDGAHSLRLRVWDTCGNLAEQYIDCFVDSKVRPEIFSIYTDANPASTQANFYISHNRPDAMLTVKVEVFNLLGQPVWNAVSTGRSDMFTSSPVTWNLTDLAGRRVKRGIYLYRASIVMDNEEYVTSSSRIAVTAP